MFYLNNMLWFTGLEDVPEGDLYPRSDVTRFSMSAAKRDWKKSFPQYNPATLNIESKGYYLFKLSQPALHFVEVSFTYYVNSILPNLTHIAIFG